MSDYVPSAEESMNDIAGFLDTIVTAIDSAAEKAPSRRDRFAIAIVAGLGVASRAISAEDARIYAERVLDLAEALDRASAERDTRSEGAQP